MTPPLPLGGRGSHSEEASPYQGVPTVQDSPPQGLRLGHPARKRDTLGGSSERGIESWCPGTPAPPPGVEPGSQKGAWEDLGGGLGGGSERTAGTFPDSLLREQPSDMAAKPLVVNVPLKFQRCTINY